MQKFTRQGGLSELETPGKPSGDTYMGKSVKSSFNHANIGRPLTGRHDFDVAQNAKRYNIFGSAGVGEHFGRSGSPKGKSPRV